MSMNEEARGLFAKGNSILDRVTFDGTIADGVAQQEALNLFDKAAIAAPEWDRPHIQKCFLLTKMMGEGTRKLFDAAGMALRAAPSVDAIDYLFSGAFASLSRYELGQAIDVYRPLVQQEPNCRALFDFYIGIADYMAGNFAAYCERLQSFRSHCLQTNFRPYLYTQSLTSNASNSVKPLGGEIKIALAEHKHGRPIICVSCDIGYYRSYSRHLFGSLKHAGDIELSLCLVSHASGQSSDLTEVKSSSPPGIRTSQMLVPDGSITGPTASLARFLVANLLRSKTAAPILVMDFDALFCGAVGQVLDKITGDIGIRELDGRAPWQRITAGFVVFTASERATLFLDLVSTHARNVLDPSERQWWIDQNCLEAAWRHCATQGPAVRTSNVLPYHHMAVYLPTGSPTLKDRLLTEKAR